MRKIYTANVRRSGQWWAIDVPELPGVFSQARRLGQVEATVRDAVALFLDVPADSFGVRVRVDLAGQDVVIKALAAKVRAATAQAEASNVQREAVKKLSGAGLTTREIGDILKISHQRVAQLRESGPVDVKGARAPLHAGVEVEDGLLVLYEYLSRTNALGRRAVSKTLR